MFTLNADHEEHLKLLSQHPVNVIQDFCKLAADFFQKGHNYKLYNAAAQKLEVELDHIKQCTEGLVYLLIECTKNKLKLESFEELIVSVGFIDKKKEALSELYQAKQSEFQELLNDSGFKLPSYHDMEWRFEVQVASRSMLSQLEPIITMDFMINNMNQSDTPEHIILQSDATNLLHLTQELEMALQEGKSQHIRKIQRLGKQ